MMELAAIEKMLKQSPAYATEAGNYIMLFDINQYTHNTMKLFAAELRLKFDMTIVPIGYDPHMGPEAIQLYKVST